MYLPSKEPCAVFRGSLTQGQRAAWCRRKFRNADVACTSMNASRRRIDPVTLNEVALDFTGAPRLRDYE